MNSHSQAPGVSESCFSEDTALRFATAKSDASERTRVHAHLDSGCTNCQQLLNRVVHAVDPEGGTVWGKHWCFTTFRKGQLLDNRYRIDRYIDRGGMGEVYEAFDCLLGMRVAIKTVSSTLSDDFEASAQIKTEVQHALRVNHRNVCRIYSLSVHQPQSGSAILFLTMELVEGVTLGSRIDATGKLPAREAVRLGSEILSGMAAAHDAGVLHRDLKSNNIMLRPGRNGTYAGVIMDFGLAVALPSDGRSHVSGDHAMVGSIQYMPPEQVQGDKLRIESDVYSFGVVLFEMLTGRLPFQAEQPAMSGLLRRLLEDAPRVRSIAPEVPEALDEIVARCLKKVPKERYGSAQAALNALKSSGLWEDDAEFAAATSSYPAPTQVSNHAASNRAEPRPSRADALGRAEAKDGQSADELFTAQTLEQTLGPLNTPRSSFPNGVSSPSAEGDYEASDDPSRQETSEGGRPSWMRDGNALLGRRQATTVGALAALLIALGLGIGFSTRENGSNKSALRSSSSPPVGPQTQAAATKVSSGVAPTKDDVTFKGSIPPGPSGDPPRQDLPPPEPPNVPQAPTTTVPPKRPALLKHLPAAKNTPTPSTAPINTASLPAARTCPAGLICRSSGERALPAPLTSKIEGGLP